LTSTIGHLIFTTIGKMAHANLNEKKLIKSIVIQNFVVIHVFQLELEIDRTNCPCFRTWLLPTLKKFNDYSCSN
jgi:hypothetical protein